MKFTELELPGVFLVELDLVPDERGFFARSFEFEEFEERGLNPRVAQCSVSWNARRGVLRGLHYQAEPHAEDKLVRCTRGAIYDVCVDIRAGSPSRHRWVASELTADNRRALYVPKGCAHGFQALEDGSEVFYQISEAYHPESARGLRWDDPAIGVRWPLPDPLLSARDRSHPLLARTC